MMVAIATIVFGVALLIQGGAMLSEYTQVVFPGGVRTSSIEQMGGNSLALVFLVGAGGIVLGVLSLLGIGAAVLTSVAAQDSRKGRHAHARRQGQWRARQQIVTHQGSPAPPCADVLPPDEATAPQTGANQSCKCHFCGRSVCVFVRQGFLGYRFRHPSNRTLRSADLNDHYP